MEGWRPLLKIDFDSLAIYKQRSIDLVKARFPSWTNKNQIFDEAAREYKIGAR